MKQTLIAALALCVTLTGCAGMVKYTLRSRELVSTSLASDSIYLHVISEPTVETPVLLVDATDVVKLANVYRLGLEPDLPNPEGELSCGCLFQLCRLTFAKPIEKETTELSTERRDADVQAFIEPQGTEVDMFRSGQGRRKFDLREASDEPLGWDESPATRPARRKLDLREVSDALSPDHDMRFILVSANTAAVMAATQWRPARPASSACTVLVSKEVTRAVVQQARLEAARRKQAKAQAEREIVEAARGLMVVNAVYQQLQYELRYETFSTDLERKAKEVGSYAEHQVGPATERYGRAIKAYLADASGEELRDLAIKNGFLHLLR